MKYFAIGVIMCCFILNFVLYKDYNDKKSNKKISKKNTLNNTGHSAEKATLRVVKKSQVAPPSDPVPALDNEKVSSLNLGFRRIATPSFYRGIYLHNYSACVTSVLKRFIKKAKRYKINSFVMDVQDAVYFRTYMISKKNVKLCVDNGIYPIARIVVFPYGLKHYPVSEKYLAERLAIAMRAAKMGFSEIQFDYIRFEDSGRLGWVKKHKRFALIEGFLSRAKRMLAPYGVKVSADVFGRVALNKSDPIGQRLEGLDKAVDLICPMVYPSHYSWSRRMMANPYYTVYTSGVRARKRLRSARLVMYIQGFILRVRYSGLSLPVYIAHQIKASEDAKTKGFIVWNAAQRYAPTYRAIELCNSGRPLPGLRKAKTAPKRKKRANKRRKTQVIYSSEVSRVKVDSLK